MEDPYYPDNWQGILQRMAAIRDNSDYSTANIDFIKDQLESPDDRIRGGAALTAEGCVFEPQILDVLIEMAESEQTTAVRKAVLQSLGHLIHEGVDRQFETGAGPDTQIEYFEEWDELQTKSLQEDYFRVKNILFSIIQDEHEDVLIREACLNSLSDLGFLTEVREWVADFIDDPRESSKITALKAMGKYPYQWISELALYLDPGQTKPILMEAISSSYSSGSSKLASRIVSLLGSKDPDILAYAIMTLANINQTENLGSILQQFSVHEDEKVRNAAKEAIVLFSQKSLNNTMKEIGFED